MVKGVVREHPPEEEDEDGDLDEDLVLTCVVIPAADDIVV